MAKAVWLNPLTTGSTSLDTSLNPHDVDALALTRLLESEGFEVWLHESFTKKSYHSPWPNKVFKEDLHSFDADIALLTVGPFMTDYLGHRFWEEIAVPTSRALQFQMVSDWLDSFDGPVYTLITDPRPNFQELYKNKKREKIAKKHPLHNMFDHLDRSKLLVADPAFLDESLRSRGVVCDYWKVVRVGEPLPFNEDNDYFCVYPGMKIQKGVRKRLVTNWMDVPGCYTLGELELNGIPSASNFQKVPLSGVLDFTRRSTTSLICGEPTHTWLTPRVVQSLMCGTISSIHPDFAGSHHLPLEITQQQTVQAASFFDVELSERVYNRQVEFIMSLGDGKLVSGVH